MTRNGNAIYRGTVVHRRVRPLRHTLKYQVFALLVDCGELAALGKRLSFFSHNRFNLISLHDRDHTEAGSLNDYLRNIAIESGQGDAIQRFLMLTYPRILGYAFNPLTVYYGLDRDGQPRLMIYEVNNTFGERLTYVIPVEAGTTGLVAQSCDKQLYVSPFNSVEGRYLFHVTPPAETLTVGVALQVNEAPVMLAHFHAEGRALTDRGLLAAVMATGWMTVKVIAGIHYEAAKLWWKGLKLQPRPKAPESHIVYETAVSRTASDETANEPKIKAVGQ